jgi:hypothetical protein
VRFRTGLARLSASESGHGDSSGCGGGGTLALSLAGSDGIPLALRAPLFLSPPGGFRAAAPLGAAPRTASCRALDSAASSANACRATSSLHPTLPRQVSEVEGAQRGLRGREKKVEASNATTKPNLL